MPTKRTSIAGKAWLYNEPDPRQVITLTQRYGMELSADDVVVATVSASFFILC